MNKAKLLFLILLVISSISGALMGDEEDLFKVKFGVVGNFVKMFTNEKLGLTYLIDRRAKICLALLQPPKSHNSNDSITAVSCDEIIKAYPKVKEEVKW